MHHVTEVLDEWMTFVATTYNDVYLTTDLQVIQWMQNPTGTVSLRDFEEWKGRNDRHPSILTEGGADWKVWRG